VTEPGAPPAAPEVRRGAASVVLSSASAVSPFGYGLDALLAGVLAGRPAFVPVERFDVSRHRVGVAATMPGDPVLRDELVQVVVDACDAAGLSHAQRAGTPLFLAIHGDPELARAPREDRSRHGADAFAASVAARAGLDGVARAYTSACVAASTAVADAAATVARLGIERVVVAAGYFVEPDQYALFSAGRALADDGQVRPFSAGRRGLLLGDSASAVVVESAAAAAMRGATPLARLAGWGRTGDAYHPVQPRPDGSGLARAIAAALARGGVGPADVGYVNAHGSGTAQSDAAEAAALHAVLGEYVAATPVSSTKSLHGQALEASGLLELIITVLATRAGQLPVNASFLGPDDGCALDLVLDAPRRSAPAYALSLNAAFGGANTALLVGAP
jgi:3-oxoacyl-[acyl-carrier-protein] synthase II